MRAEITRRSPTLSLSSAPTSKQATTSASGLIQNHLGRWSRDPGWDTGSEPSSSPAAARLSQDHTFRLLETTGLRGPNLKPVKFTQSLAPLPNAQPIVKWGFGCFSENKGTISGLRTSSADVQQPGKLVQTQPKNDTHLKNALGLSPGGDTSVSATAKDFRNRKKRTRLTGPRWRLASNPRGCPWRKPGFRSLGLLGSQVASWPCPRVRCCRGRQPWGCLGQAPLRFSPLSPAPNSPPLPGSSTPRLTLNCSLVRAGKRVPEPLSRLTCAT